MNSAELKYGTPLDRFLKALPEQGLILELNSGNCSYSKMFHEKGYDLLVAELDTEMPPVKNAYAKQTYFKPLLDLVIPFRTLSGIWGHHSFKEYELPELHQFLSHMIDWLIPGGVLFLSFLEGEGKKEIHHQLPFSKRKKVIVYQQPDQLATLLDAVGFTVLDAWREEGKGDQQLLQILCQA